MKLKVVKTFRDKFTKEILEIGKELATNDVERANDLVARGFCVITSLEPVPETETDGDKDKDPVKIAVFEKEYDLQTVKDALNSIEVKVAYNAGVAAVGKKLAELTEEQLKALAEILNKE